MSHDTDRDQQGLELASALCARLCHDISSPLGTLSGTLELAVEEPEQAAEALSIAGESAQGLVKRLQLLRAAWAGDCGSMDRERLADLAGGLPRRVQADLAELSEGPFEAGLTRVLLNLLLLGAEALPAGGVVALSGQPDSGIVVSVVGRSVAWHAGLANALRNPAAPGRGEPRTVQVPLTVGLAHAAGLRLSFLLGAEADPAGPPRLLLERD